MSAPESFAAFRARLEQATLAMMNGDSAAWSDTIFSHAPDATLFGGWGGTGEKGREQLGARWKMVAGRFKAAPTTSLKIERVSEHVRDDFAVTAELVRGVATFADGSHGPMALRVTHVCRRENGEWRIVHRHADEQIKLTGIETHLNG